MRTKIRWIALLAAICLISAVTASVLTAIFLMRGAFGYRALLQPPEQEIPENTTAGTWQDPSPTNAPSVTPATPTRPATPTPEPTATPTPDNEPTPTPDPDKGNDPDETAPLWQSPDWLSVMYSQVAPSVVGIRVEVDETSFSVRRTNEGSGIIMNEDGIIVTSTDILAIALDRSGKLLANARIEVLVHDHNRPLRAELVGRDPMTRISVLKINARYLDLKPAVIAQDPVLQIGQLVFAIGYPDLLRESGSMISGIISGLDPPISLEDGTTLQMIRTDARISQSCSGGALVNLEGEVIAVTACDPTRSAFDVLSYAIPAQAAGLVVEDLTSQGYVGGRAWLGVTVLVEDTFIELQNLYKFPDGLYINSVIEGSPAYLADLRRGDIITGINGAAVNTSMDISDFLQSQPVGTMVEIVVYRRMEEQYYECNVYLQEYKH